MIGNCRNKKIYKIFKFEVNEPNQEWNGHQVSQTNWKKTILTLNLKGHERFGTDVILTAILFSFLRVKFEADCASFF